MLYLGVHFSLEEAYSVARMQMDDFVKHTPGEPMNIELWNNIPARQLMPQLMDPMKVEVSTPLPIGISSDIPKSVTPSLVPNLMDAIPRLVGPVHPPRPISVKERVEEMRESKNELMKQLIDSGSLATLNKLRSFLGPNSSKYVLSEIAKKKASKL